MQITAVVVEEKKEENNDKSSRKCTQYDEVCWWLALYCFAQLRKALAGSRTDVQYEVVTAERTGSSPVHGIHYNDDGNLYEVQQVVFVLCSTTKRF